MLRCPTNVWPYTPHQMTRSDWSNPTRPQIKWIGIAQQIVSIQITFEINIFYIKKYIQFCFFIQFINKYQMKDLTLPVKWWITKRSSQLQVNAKALDSQKVWELWSLVYWRRDYEPARSVVSHFSWHMQLLFKHTVSLPF